MAQTTPVQLSEDQKKHFLEHMAQVINDLHPNMITASLDAANPFQSKGVVDVNSTDTIFTEMIKHHITNIQKQQPPHDDQASVLKQAEELKTHSHFVSDIFKEIIQKHKDVMAEAAGVQIPSAEFLDELNKFKQQHLKEPNTKPAAGDNHAQKLPENSNDQKTVEKKPSENNQQHNQLDHEEVKPKPADSNPEPKNVEKKVSPKQAETVVQPKASENHKEPNKSQDPSQKPNEGVSAKHDQSKASDSKDDAKQSTVKKQPLQIDTTEEEHVDPKTLNNDAPQPNSTKKQTSGDIKTEHTLQQQPSNKLAEVKSLLDNLNLKDEAALKQQLNDLKSKLTMMENTGHFAEPHITSQRNDNNMHYEESPSHLEQSFDNQEISPYQDEKQQSPRGNQQQSPQKRPKVVDMVKLREKGMMEIYNFYCKQHLMGVQKMTFEALGKEGQKMLFGDFLKMCQDFSIQIKKDQLQEIYRMKVRRHGGAQHLDYQLFLELLAEVFQHLHFEQSDQRGQQLIEMQQQLYELTRDNPDIIDNQEEAQLEHDHIASIQNEIQALESAQEMSMKSGSSKKKAWKGSYQTQNGVDTQEMLIEHMNFNKNRVEGSGTDDQGEFTITGTIQISTNLVEFIKQYASSGAHSTHFNGSYSPTNQMIQGSWKIKGSQESGTFMIERDSDHQSQTKEVYQYFLEKGHSHLQTTNKPFYLSKMKGFHRAFGGQNDHSDPQFADKLKKMAPHLGQTKPLNIDPTNNNSMNAHRKNDSNASAALSKKTNPYQDNLESSEHQNLKLRQLSVKSQIQQQEGDGRKQQEYHVRERHNQQAKIQDKQNRQWLKEQALERIRNGQARIGMREYSESKIDVPRSQGNYDQSSIIGDQHAMIDHENISLGESASPKQARQKKPSKNMTLEQLRNIPNPKDLFTKRDREQFAQLLGLDEDEFPQQTITTDKSPKHKQNNILGPSGIRNRNTSITQKSVDRASKNKSTIVPSSNNNKNNIQTNRGEYVDQRSMDYHKKIMNRANEIENQIKNKKQREGGAYQQGIHPHLIKDNSKDLLTQKKTQRGHLGTDLGSYDQGVPANQRKLQNLNSVRHSSVVRSGAKGGESPKLLKSKDQKGQQGSPIRQSQISPKQQKGNAKQSHQAILPGGGKQAVGGPAQNIMIQQQQEQLRQMQQQLSVLKNQQKRFY